MEDFLQMTSADGTKLDVKDEDRSLCSDVLFLSFMVLVACIRLD